MKPMKREPTKPGVILRRIIDETEGLSQEKLSKELGVSFQTISQIVNGHRAVSAGLAVRLARRLDTTPQFWLNMQNAVDLYRAEAQLDRAAG